MPAPVFKIPCSLIHKIMGEPKKKGEKLSEGAKSFCESWIMNKLYGKSGFGFAWQCEKGLAVEQDALDYINKIWYPKKNLIKNVKSYENDYFIGIPDVIDYENKQIIDIKCPWSHASFPLMHDEINNKEYYWQLQGYLDLVDDIDCRTGTLIYVLMDTPEHIVVAQAKKLHAEMNGKKSLEELIDEYKNYLSYSDYDETLRLHHQSTKKNINDISAIIEKVIECRKYLKPFIDKITWDD